MPTPTDTYTSLMKRIEVVVRTMVGARFQSAEDIWQLQLDLLAIQVDLHSGISALRRQREEHHEEEQATVSARTQGWRDRAGTLQKQKRLIEAEIDTLRHALAKARSAGDALAWVLFPRSERFLRPLTHNSRVGSIPDFYSRLGVMSVATEFASNGGGFPVLHDITNILRIGDITFVHPDRNPVTVEIKTKLLEESADGDSLKLEVEVWAVGDQARLLLDTTKSLPAMAEIPETDTSWVRHGNKARLRRQLARMDKARLFQDAAAGEIFNEQERPVVVLEWSMQSPHSHWEIVRELATRAKSDKFTSTAVDGAMLYAAIYTDQPVHLLGSSKELLTSTVERLPGVLAQSGIFYPPPDVDRNTLWFGISLAYDEDSTALNHLPFLLYPLDEEQVVDMLWGRLWFFVGVNVGKIQEELQHRGYESEFCGQQDGSEQDFLRIRKETVLPDGKQGVLDLRNTSMFGSKLLHEFMSLAGFCDMIEAAIEGMEPHVKNGRAPISFSEDTH